MNALQHRLASATLLDIIYPLIWGSCGLLAVMNLRRLSHLSSLASWWTELLLGLQYHNLCMFLDGGVNHCVWGQFPTVMEMKLLQGRAVG